MFSLSMCGFWISRQVIAIDAKHFPFGRLVDAYAGGPDVSKKEE